jgi:RNA polymerase sigma-70 factor (ECF subfamily)
MAHKVINYLVKDISEIIEGCLKNDRRSQFMLYDYCFDSMMGICMRYEKDETRALEVLNSAFIKVLKGLETFDTSLAFQPWCNRLTVNEAIDKYREKARRREVFDQNHEELENCSYETDYQLNADWEEAEYLQNLINKLKESEKTVFNLFAIDGYSHKEIAAVLGITERSSIRHLTNARKKLQEMLPQKEYGIKKA